MQSYTHIRAPIIINNVKNLSDFCIQVIWDNVTVITEQLLVVKLLLIV